MLEYRREPFNNSEMVQTITSMFNEGKITVKNLKVTGEAEIGNWRIKNDVIGIKGRGDIKMTDQIRIHEFDSGTYWDRYFNVGKLWVKNDITIDSTRIQDDHLKILKGEKEIELQTLAKDMGHSQYENIKDGKLIVWKDGYDRVYIASHGGTWSEGEQNKVKEHKLSKWKIIT